MAKIKYILLILICITLTNCKTEEHQFPLEKRYWDVNDYNDVILELKYGYEDDETLPVLSDPETRIIIEKLTDQQNFKIILDDDELGLKHKNKIAEKFFEEWRNMNSIYNTIDRKDQYLYEIEMLSVSHFGLSLQLRYFKLGNDEIKEGADDPNSDNVKNTITSNVNTLIDNYLIYLDEINNEKAYTEKGKAKFANGIDIYFSELIETYPKANYNAMKTKAELMLKKTSSEKIKSSLQKLIQKIDSKKE